MTRRTYPRPTLPRGLAALLLVAGLAAVLGASTARAQEPSGEVVDLGQEVASLLRDDNIGAVADRFDEQTLVCPGEDVSFRTARLRRCWRR
ncbi:MAG: hypothetical protein U5Q44_10380 [Dehalococcoidia bacterium]|nr:hypothetical protein [Dehalococcoidia bacterium]